MRMKTTAARIGTALVDIACEIADSSIRSDIDQIDKEQDALREQLTRLEEKRAAKVSSLTNR